MELEASLCADCGTSQNSWLRLINTFSSPITLAISFVAIAISILAYFNSTRTPVSNPLVEVQTISFGPSDFEFFAYNTGNAPSLMKGVDLVVSLSQQGGTYSLKASFDFNEPVFLEAGTTERMAVLYDSFLPRWTRWTVSDPAPNEPFSSDFLGIAAKLGNNLHCEINVIYSRSGYHDFHASSSSRTNGNCVDAMDWFAAAVGPLKAENSDNLDD